MEHRWGQRREVRRFVRLRTRTGVTASGRMCNVSISGALVVTPLAAKLMSYVEIRFVAMQGDRRIAASVEGQVVRRGIAGLGIEWCEFGHPAVLAILRVPPYRASAAAVLKHRPRTTRSLRRQP